MATPIMDTYEACHHSLQQNILTRIPALWVKGNICQNQTKTETVTVDNSKQFIVPRLVSSEVVRENCRSLQNTVVRHVLVKRKTEAELKIVNTTFFPYPATSAEEMGGVTMGPGDSWNTTMFQDLESCEAVFKPHAALSLYAYPSDAL